MRKLGETWDVLRLFLKICLRRFYDNQDFLSPLVMIIFTARRYVKRSICRRHVSVCVGSSWIQRRMRRNTPPHRWPLSSQRAKVS